MCSMISAQGVAVATAMAVSGTVILLALRLQNQKSFPPPEFSVHEIPPSPHPVLRSCISSVGKKKMKKKRVHFAKDVVESCKDGEEFRKRNSRSKVHYEEDEEEAKIGRVNVMPANRAALYNGILRDRVAQRLAYSC